jgi:hypothetical protein
MIFRISRIRDRCHSEIAGFAFTIIEREAQTKICPLFYIFALKAERRFSMRYILATMVGGVMVSTSFIAGAICMYAMMTGPYPNKDEPKEVEE